MPARLIPGAGDSRRPPAGAVVNPRVTPRGPWSPLRIRRAQSPFLVVMAPRPEVDLAITAGCFMPGQISREPKSGQLSPLHDTLSGRLIHVIFLKHLRQLFLHQSLVQAYRGCRQVVDVSSRL